MTNSQPRHGRLARWSRTERGLRGASGRVEGVGGRARGCPPTSPHRSPLLPPLRYAQSCPRQGGLPRGVCRPYSQVLWPGTAAAVAASVCRPQWMCACGGGGGGACPADVAVFFFFPAPRRLARPSSPPPGRIRGSGAAHPPLPTDTGGASRAGGGAAHQVGGRRGGEGGAVAAAAPAAHSDAPGACPGGGTCPKAWDDGAARERFSSQEGVPPPRAPLASLQWVQPARRPPARPPPRHLSTGPTADAAT